MYRYCCCAMRMLISCPLSVQVPGGLLLPADAAAAGPDAVMPNIDWHRTRESCLNINNIDCSTVAALHNCLAVLAASPAFVCKDLRFASCRFASNTFERLSSGPGGSAASGSSPPHLQSVHSVWVRNCWGMEGGLEAPLSGLVRALPGLRSIWFRDLDLSEGLPSGIRELRHIKTLDCQSCRLAALEGGPWLSSACNIVRACDVRCFAAQH